MTTEIMLAIACTLLAGRVGRFLILLIGRSTPAMHRILINAMRRRLRDEEDQFAEKHGHRVDEPEDDPVDEPEKWR